MMPDSQNNLGASQPETNNQAPGTVDMGMQNTQEMPKDDQMFGPVQPSAVANPVPGAVDGVTPNIQGETPLQEPSDPAVEATNTQESPVRPTDPVVEAGKLERGVGVPQTEGLAPAGENVAPDAPLAPGEPPVVASTETAPAEPVATAAVPGMPPVPEVVAPGETPADGESPLPPVMPPPENLGTLPEESTPPAVPGEPGVDLSPVQDAVPPSTELEALRSDELRERALAEIKEGRRAVDNVFERIEKAVNGVEQEEGNRLNE
ncbi:MAG TPA: hypothetical protein PLG93_01675 [bacterium]|nr:hypothetical protein [bacterium]